MRGAHHHRTACQVGVDSSGQPQLAVRRAHAPEAGSALRMDARTNPCYVPRTAVYSTGTVELAESCTLVGRAGAAIELVWAGCAALSRRMYRDLS